MKKKVYRDNEIAIPKSAAMAQQDDAIFDAVAKAGDWLPRLQLIGANSGLAQEGKVPVGSYALIMSKDNATNLGNAVDMFVLAWRARASDLGGEQVVSVFDINDPVFKEIQAKSAEKDSGCMFGPEFLIWIPSVQKFATYFMGSATGRVAAPKVRAFMSKGCTLKSALISKGKYKWHGPVVTPCSAPGAAPSAEKLETEVDKFLNPPKTSVEAADAPTSDREI